MSFLKTKTKNFYCAFCRTARSIRDQKHVQLFEVLICLGGSALLMLMIWQSFDFRMIPIFAILICAVEFMIQIKHRMLMNCPHCGFDPHLYKQNVAQCVEKVKAHLEARNKDPLSILSSRPKLHLPYAKPKPEGQANAKMETKLGALVRKSAHGKNLDVRL